MTTTAPHTDPNAKVQATQSVVDCRVIKCDSVSYRNASFGGVFLLAPKETVTNEDGGSYALVDMQWHGWKPERGSCRITLLGDYAIDDHYTGEVVAEVG